MQSLTLIWASAASGYAVYPHAMRGGQVDGDGGARGRAGAKVTSVDRVDGDEVVHGGDEEVDARAVGEGK